MRIALLASVLPSRSEGGRAMTIWSITKEARARKHDVSLIYLNEGSVPNESIGNIEADLGMAIHEVAFGARKVQRGSAQRVLRLMIPQEVDLYPWAEAGPEVYELLRRIGPDVLVAYETRSASVAPRYSPWPKAVAFVDLDHLPGRFRRGLGERQSWKGRVVALRDRLYRSKMMMGVLREQDLVVNFAAHHAMWLRRRGVPCMYLPTPIPHPVLHGRAAKRGGESAPPLKDQDATVRILLTGHLRGTATLLGLKLFASRILPLLRRHANGKFEVRIVGAEADWIPRRLQRSLNSQEVKFAGFVNDVSIEFRQADVLLVPTPVRIGTRVRIIDGLSFGCCVIAHSANHAGIPELTHGYDCLLGDSGKALANWLLRAIENASLRASIGANGKRTFDSRFSSAPSQFVNLVEGLARGVPS